MRTILSGGSILGVSLLLVLTLPTGTARRVDAAAASSAERHGGPEAPRSLVDTAFPGRAGRTIHVAAGGNLQRALDEARAGDLITLEPRAVYRGPFHLPLKDGSGWIVVSTAAANLPAPGQRIDPTQTASLPKLIASSGAVIDAARGAHHYRFVGIEIAPADGFFLYELVTLGRDETEPGALPHHIVFDRCYLHGDPARGTRRGIAMNSRETAVIDSYLSDFKDQGADSQAIAGWNGPGPFKIANNYLEAAGENVMFGGADPAIRDLVPADIEIRNNHLAKPLGWKAGRWSIKNLFELKNARRVLIEGNLFEYNWPQAQNGFAILFTVRNQDGRAPWSAVEDVLFADNVVRHVGAGINVLGHDDIHPSQPVRRIEIRNNLFLDVGGSWGTGRLFQLLQGTSDVVIDHNTALQTGDALFGGDGAPHTGFVFEDNIALNNAYGITGSGAGPGVPALTRYFPASAVRGNVIVGGSASNYPAGNFFPRTVDDVGFDSYRDGRYRLTGRSLYARAGTDGRSPGADLATPGASTAEVVPPLESPASATTVAFRTAGFSVVGPGRLRAWIFWAVFALLAYVYFGYPLLAALRAAIRPRPHATSSAQPMVSVIVAAYNEGDRIAARIENLLALDYPPDRLEIIVGSDGSTDDTVSRARRYEDQGVQVRPFSDRRGKPALLNRLVPDARGEIVVFADARQQFDRGALRALLANFADATVGAVSGALMLTADRGAAAGQGTSFYWRYEKFIRSMESRTDSTVGVTGAIYAIRRGLFEPIPGDTILDDLVIPLRIVRHGSRVLFEPRALAYDRTPATAREEFSRKARTIAGTFQLFARERWLFNPRANRLWFQTLSHKGLRLLLPALHFSLFAANLALLDLWLYRWTLSAQLVFYAAALLGCTTLFGRRRPLFVSVAYTMCLLCWATIVGCARTLTHGQPVTWQRVAN